MPGISIHVVDVSRGVVATSMRVELRFAVENERYDLILDGAIDSSGHLVHHGLSRTFDAGRYRAVFHVGGYYRHVGVATAAVPFLEWCVSTSASPTPPSIITCRSNARHGATRASAAAPRRRAKKQGHHVRRPSR
jgi:5-hydroxyisourate hydrolase